MTNFSPLLMTAADRHRLLADLSAAGLHGMGAPAAPAPKSVVAAAATPARAPAPAAKPVVTAWPDTLRSILSAVRTKLEAI